MQMSRFANAVPKTVLLSPAHRVLSGKYAVLSFTGLRSGRRYTTPIAYVRDGDTVWLSTDSPWWRNVVGGATVQLRLRGRDHSGVTTVIQDEADTVAALRRLVDAIPSYAKPAGLRRIDGRVPDEELLRAVRQGRRSIRVALASTAVAT